MWLEIMNNIPHYNDVKTGVIASLITSLTSVYSTVSSGADQRKHKNSASLAFVCGIHRGPVRVPRTNGQWRGKCFHLMTSSWHCLTQLTTVCLTHTDIIPLCVETLKNNWEQIAVTLCIGVCSLQSMYIPCFEIVSVLPDVNIKLALEMNLRRDMDQKDTQGCLSLQKANIFFMAVTRI